MSRGPVNPLVAIVGATGTGKSDLAVDIARRFDGEIINGDAMQLYQGLPIITNKVTEDEMKGIPHHLLGCIGLEEETWTVGKFVTKALGVISEIRGRGKLPILVGGTHYYTQSLLFQDALSDEPLLELKETDQAFPILDEPTDVILAKLKEVDPVMAERWHPNDRRKILRSLQIYLRTGKPASQVYSEQREKREASPTDSGTDHEISSRIDRMRCPTLLLWVHASKDVLYPRLDARIMKMVDKGLLAEVNALARFRKSHERQLGEALDQSRGIWVSIGYKEFLDYQTALEEGISDNKALERLKNLGVEKMQAATRQYANRQLRWIRIKLLNALYGANAKESTFLLDGSDLGKWEENVLVPARDITTKFLAGQLLPVPSDVSILAGDMLSPKRDYDLAHRPDLWQKKVCDVCGTISVTENEWNQHIKSRGHRRTVAAENKRDAAPRKDFHQRKPQTHSSTDIIADGADIFGENDRPNEEKM
ncbi:tRNA isopentenyltransferas-like protein [Polyplosphaeria fusca]|uniref:tRNA dimethylallyltransferase n=1 Tax=Polyplosphaeria fusca TaxID=682080 RepID=A0A9P4QW95_9PLEO|nr:tRNA isopentenyltransferas-like protein [Polyplosphaeria fusca]